MKLPAQSILLISALFALTANADCGARLDELWLSSHTIGSISAAVPENLSAIGQLQGALTKEIEAEKSAIKNSTIECLAHLGGTNEVLCHTAINKYSRASREIGFVLTNGNNEPRPDTGKVFWNSKAKIVDDCSKK